MQRAARSGQTIRSALRRHVAKDRAPPELRARVLALAAAKPRPARWSPASFRPAALAASLTLAGFIVGYLAAGPKATPPEAAATQSLVDAFARSEISGQAYDIASSDRHTVKPWLAARTALGSEVIDLSDAGFPLAGGRLDIIDGAPVATLVYRHKEHWIDVTELPLGAASVASAENVATVKGFHIRRWSDGLRAYVAVSDIDDGELADFVIAFRKRVEAARASKEP